MLSPKNYSQFHVTSVTWNWAFNSARFYPSFEKNVNPDGNFIEFQETGTHFFFHKQENQTRYVLRALSVSLTQFIFWKQKVIVGKTSRLRSGSGPPKENGCDSKQKALNRPYIFTSLARGGYVFGSVGLSVCETLTVMNGL